jgi:hypothetical protein
MTTKVRVGDFRLVRSSYLSKHGERAELFGDFGQVSVDGGSKGPHILWTTGRYALF